MDVSILAVPGGQDVDMKNVGRCDLDSHADTTVCGANTILLEDTGQMVDVSPYSGEYESIKDIPIGTCATSYDCPNTGKTYLLIFGQALYFGDRLSKTLICPNQMRDYGTSVQDVPTQYDQHSNHSILTIDNDREPWIEIPLTLDGVISGFDSRVPTPDEVLNSERIVLTEVEKEWDPHSERFADAERSFAKASVSYTISAISIAEDGRLHERLVSPGLSANGDIVHCQNMAMISTTGRNSLGQRTISATQRSVSRPSMEPETLAKRWGIGTNVAAQTLRVTTQKGIKTVSHPVQQRYASQRYLSKRVLPGKWYTDTTFFKVKGLGGEIGAQLTTNGKGYSRFWPVRTRAEASLGLVDLINNDGIPEHLISDDSKEQGGNHAWKSAWHKVIQKYHINHTYTEPHSWWQNRAELEIREVKRAIRRMTNRAGSPKRLWSYLGHLVVRLRSLTASTHPSMGGRTPYETVRGYTPDITPWIAFEWYEWVFYLDEDKEQHLARWLGPAETYGAGNCHWLLPVSGRPIVRSTVWQIPSDVKDTEAMVETRKSYATKINDLIGDGSIKPSEVLTPDLPPYGDLFEPDELEEADPVEPSPDVDGTESDAYDKYLSAEVMLQRGDETLKGTVVRRVKDNSGHFVGTANTNPLLDSRQYEVEFPDGATEAYTANVIAENLYSQVDDTGRQFAVLRDIIEHKKDGTALGVDEGYILSHNGNRTPKRTTRGWQLLVEWADGTSEWVRLADIKESNPVQVAQYARDNHIANEPAFAWWVPEVLRKKDRILAKVKTRYWKRTHKYGIRIPKSVKEALEIDQETGTDYWAKAIDKEMKNVRVAFEFRNDDGIPVGCTEIRCHMVFDIKITLVRKARFCANGNELEEPKEDTFASVVSRDSVRIFFLLAALNDLEVLSADIQNAYLTAKIRGNYWYRCGLEFGADAGRPARIVRALYGLKSAGATFRSHLATTLRKLGYKSCRADPDVWMRKAVKPDGTRYYEYMLAYVDDLLGCSHKAKEAFDTLGQAFKFKDGVVEQPSLYLGADIKTWTIHNAPDPQKPRWAMSSTNYVKKAISEVETELKAAGKILKTKVKTPLATKYRPELDRTKELDPKRQNYYQGLIGVLRWICELGRVDILMPVSLMSRYLAQAREGHLDQLFHVFAYLKEHARSHLVFDDTELYIDERRFRNCDWSEYYPEAREAIPKDSPEPRGKQVQTTCFVDADHAGCLETRRSHTGVLIFVNKAPIVWYSKRQTTVETSTYGSEIVALRIAIELVEGLRYKLRMMGVPLDGATTVLCDNQSVVLNTTHPESSLKKKANAIAYHKARESIATGMIRVAKEDGETNVSDLFTKLLGGPRLRNLTAKVLW